MRLSCWQCAIRGEGQVITINHPGSINFSLHECFGSIKFATYMVAMFAA